MLDWLESEWLAASVRQIHRQSLLLRNKFSEGKLKEIITYYLTKRALQYFIFQMMYLFT